MKVALPALFLFVFSLLPDQSNSWRGITPLHSTCEDVKRILNVDRCSDPPYVYTVPDFEVMIDFKNKDCDEAPHTWRVPKGTVIAIMLSPRRPMLPSEFGIDLSKYKKSDHEEIVGMERYYNQTDGVSVEVYQGAVLDLLFYPRKADEALRCKPAKTPNQQTPGL